jgi:hypothetical protein
VVPLATGNGRAAVVVPYIAVLVTVAPTIVDKVGGPPGGLTQIFSPARIFVQKLSRVGFHATICWTVTEACVAIP